MSNEVRSEQSERRRAEQLCCEGEESEFSNEDVVVAEWARRSEATRSEQSERSPVGSSFAGPGTVSFREGEVSEQPINVNLRGLSFQLLGHTRALRLCARMNREIEVLDFIDEIPRGSVFYDLGACEGRFSVYAALRGLRVYAFEPEARNFETMLGNISLNELEVSQIQPVKQAISDRVGDVQLQIGQEWAGGHHRVLKDVANRSDLQFQFSSEQLVPTTSLDHLIYERNFPFPEYLKVDIDGSEQAFLKGAEQTLRDDRLHSMIIELYEEDPKFSSMIESIQGYDLQLKEKYKIENEVGLYNFWWIKP